jgi:predicted nucleic acid-binding protein
VIVVSDTSVVSGLLQSDSLHILQKLYKNIVIPNEVFLELGQLDEVLFNQLFNDWIEVKQVSDNALLLELSSHLDLGEAEAITLAKDLKADILLIDEKKGRAIATQLGLSITGILGILIEAKRQNLVAEIKPIIKALTEKAGVWFKPELIVEVLKRVKEI